MRGNPWIGVLLLAGGMAARALAAPQTVTFAGSVRDARGRPAGGATVFVVFYEPARTWRDGERKPVVHRTAAAANGAFRLGVPVRSGDWSAAVVAMKDGHGPGGQELSSPNRPVGLDLSLTRPSFITGQVVDRAGVPVAGAKVKVRWAWLPEVDAGSLPLEYVRPPATSDAQGRFRIALLPARASLNLAAEHPRYAPGSSPRMHVASGMEDVILTMPPASAVIGRVVDQTGRSASGVMIRCQDRLRRETATTTDAEGKFRFGNLPNEYCVVRAVLPGHLPDLVSDPQGVLLPEGAEARCPDVRLVRGVVVSGKVTDERSRPVANVTIASRREHLFPGPMSVWADGPTTRTAADGTYRLRLPPGTWRLYPRSLPLGYLSDLERDVNGDHYPEVPVAEGRSAGPDFTLRREMVLRGWVVDALGRPAVHAKVRAIQGELIVSHAADAAGRFALRGFLPGEAVRLTIFSRDHRQGVRMEVSPELIRSEQVVRLQRLPVVAGVVLDRQGGPIADALVAATRIERRGFGVGGEGINSTIADAQGRFSLTVFPQASYSIEAVAEGFGIAEQYPVDVESVGPQGVVEPTLRLTLERADGVLAGVVVDDDGRPLAGADVSILRRGKSGIGGELSEQAVSDAQGRFRFDRLTPGEVEIWGGKTGYRGGIGQKAVVGATNVHLIFTSVAGAAPPAAGGAAAPGPRVGAPAPALQVARWVNGAGVRGLEELRGKTVVLIFSAAYNPAAQEWNAALKELHAHLVASGRQDVALLGVYDASVSADDVAAYARREGLPFPIGIVEATKNLGADSPVFRAYGVRRLPALFVIDGEGILRAVDPSREELERLVGEAGQAPGSRESAKPRAQSAKQSSSEPLCALSFVLCALPRSEEPGARSGSEATLRYTLDPTIDLIDRDGIPLRTLGQEMKLLSAPPAGVKLPPFVSDRPRFLTAELGDDADTTFLFALDETERGAGYDLLYADGNHNRDLTDEPPLRLTHWREHTGFKPVRLLIEIGGSRVLYHAALLIEGDPSGNRSAGGVPPVYRLQSWGYYSGEARFGEKRYPVALVDDDGNGRFNDLFRGAGQEASGDVLLIDGDGDGRFQPDPLAGSEFFPQARLINVEGRYYALDVRADGSGFTITPARVKLATLRSSFDCFALLLTSDEGTLVVRGKGGAAQVPLGDYRIAGWQLEQRDAQGGVWVAQGIRARGGDEPALSVTGDTFLPALGSPLQARLEVQRGAGRELQFSLRFAGAAGEAIETVTRNGQLMPPPRVKILDAHGNMLADLTFEYG